MLRKLGQEQVWVTIHNVPVDNFRFLEVVEHQIDLLDRQITLIREDLALNHAGVTLSSGMLVRVIPQPDVQHPLIAGELSGQLSVDPKLGLD